jgi:hypothetical protein
MNNDEQILAALNKLSDLQGAGHRYSAAGIREPTGGYRQPAKSIKNQVATGRIYRISLVILALLTAAFFLWFFGLWR